MTYLEVIQTFEHLPVMEDENQKKRWSYMIAHWSEYDLVNSKEDFIKLLNILHVNGENLDSLHDVVLNGRKEFCSIFGEWESDRDVVKTLWDFHFYFETKEAFTEYVDENLELESDDMKPTDEMRNEFVAYCDIRPSFHAIIERLWY